MTAKKFISPVANDQQFDNFGHMLSGGTITVYLAGTLELATIYANVEGAALSNPIVLNSSGRIPNGALYIDSEISYDIVIQSGSTVLETYHNVSVIYPEYIVSLTNLYDNIQQSIQNEAIVRFNADAASIDLIETVQTRLNSGDYAAVKTQSSTTANTVDGLKAQYTVKVDANGYVAGFGLASTNNNSTPTSEFSIVADKFTIAPVGSGAWSSNSVSYQVGNIVYYEGNTYKCILAHTSSVYSFPGLSNSAYWVKSYSPFYYISSPQTINGEVIQPGLYVNKANIAKLSADQIDTRGLSIKDSNGNIILAAGSALDFANVGGSTKPAANATKNVLTTGIIANRPVGSDGDFYFATDTNILYQKISGSWVQSANNYTNTNQLTDGANLGLSASWTYVTGRPTTLAALDSAAATQLDKKSVTYYQGIAPTGMTANDVGDVWFDTSNNYKMYSYSGTAWVLVQDSAAASAAASAAQGTANTKITTYYNTAQPTAGSNGDLWYNSSTKLLKRWNGSTWDNAGNAFDNTNQLTDGAGLGNTAIWTSVTGRPTTLAALDSAAATQLDKKSVTYYQISAPTGLGANDVGDVWFDTDDNYKMYTWTGTAWQLVQDSAAASAAAAAAQGTANTKITTYYGTTTPTGMSNGDLWYNDTTKVLKRYQTSDSTWVDVATVGAPTGTYVGGTLAETVASNAANALSGLSAKLNKAGDSITGRITLNVADGIFAGTDLNNGVYMGSSGLVGKKSGNTTFAIDTAGNAAFGGTLNGATGSFSGSLTASAVNAVNTINIAGNAVTVLSSSMGTGDCSTTLNVPANETIRITALAYFHAGATGNTFQNVTLTIDGISKTARVYGILKSGMGSFYEIPSNTLINYIDIIGGSTPRTCVISMSGTYNSYYSGTNNTLLAFGTLR
jgi:hypothetical protein